MKRVRFQVNGETLAGRFEDGRLVAEDGHDFVADDVTWLPPLVPGTIYGLALNYHDHAEELGLEIPTTPVLFIKARNTLVGHEQPVVAGLCKWLHYRQRRDGARLRDQYVPAAGQGQGLRHLRTYRALGRRGRDR